MYSHNQIKKLLSSGLTIFPCRGSKSDNPKCPIPKDWFNSKCNISEFTTDYVGMACTGGIEVLDFDNHLLNAHSIIKDFMKECYFKDKFVVNRTGGGGYHVIYRIEELEGNKKLAAQYDAVSNAWETVIETRGYGGQIIIPPSPKYRTLQGSLFDIKLISSEEREWLFNRAKQFDEKKPKECVISKVEDYNVETGGLLQRFNESSIGYNYMISVLLGNGWRMFEGNKLTRPNKKFGISATIFGKHKRLYVWSSNAHPFENQKMYNPSMVVNLLEFNGNWANTFKRIEELVNKQ